MDYKYALEKRDIARIEKLNELTNAETFWDDVRRLTRRVKGCHAIRRWEILAERRYAELEDVQA